MKSRNIGRLLGLENLYFKLENTNPTGSYKDRFAASAISHLLSGKARFCLATSSGNTGAALAAYSAAAELPCFLAIVEGTPEGKLQQMRVYGAKTCMIKGFGRDVNVTEQVMRGLQEMAIQHGASVQISAYRYCPEGMAGVQTIAYEVASELSAGPMEIFVPAGGGGLTLAFVKGFEAWKIHDSDFVLPKVNCVQPSGNNTIAGPLKNGEKRAKEIPISTTVISGLQVPNVIDGDESLIGCARTGGNGYTVDDETVFHWQQELAIKEGIYCEPAGAVALAGVANALGQGTITTTGNVVCVVSGHGFKDPLSAQQMAFRTAHTSIDTVGEMEQLIKTLRRNR